MKRFQSVWPAYVLGAMGYSLYGLFTESGPVAWINLAQQLVFGAFSLKISFLISVLLMLVVGALAWSGIERALGAVTSSRPAPATDELPRGKPSAGPPLGQGQMMWRVMLGMVAVTWLVGPAAGWWFNRQQQVDNTATYRYWSADSQASAPAEGEHLAVQGAVLIGRSVVRSSGSGASARDEGWLVPLVATGWRPGQPAKLVIQVAHPSQLPGTGPAARGQLPELNQPVLVRVGGAVPVPAAHQFGKAAVPLTPDNRLLHVVPSRNGKPLPQHTDHLEFALWASSVLSALLLLLGAMALFIHRRRAPVGR